MDMAIKKAFAAKDYTVLYGNTHIGFQLNYTSRKTLAIHVYPDTSVVVDAPTNSPIEKIQAKVLKRARWIRKQQRLFERFPPALPARKYISGESFRYLGRQYVLKVERNIINAVKLERGILRVSVTRVDQQHVKQLVDDWYRKKAEKIFSECLVKCRKIVEKSKIHYPYEAKLRIMKTRWGSCTADSIITLNPELISASKYCIEYVIVHELCHLKEHHHGNAFFKLLDYVMPDWEKRKNELELTAERRLI
jgi:predicted metal-dependent hydrolase